MKLTEYAGKYKTSQGHNMKKKPARRHGSDFIRWFDKEYGLEPL